MKRAELEALFLLAGIEIKSAYELANRYWPDAPDYQELRRDHPWWLVNTPHGLITIGWRKRVISIDWEETAVRHIVTKEDVTKEETMVHAWTRGRAVEYLTEWRREAERTEAKKVAESSAMGANGGEK